MRFSVFKELVKQSFREFLIYRTTAILTVVFSIMFYLIEVITGIVYFSFTDRIFDWTRRDYMILITTANIIQMGYQFFFVASHEGLEEAVIEGDLDYSLIRPVNSFWFYAFNRLDIPSVIGIIVSVIFQCYFFSSMKLSFFNVMMYSFGIILGIWFLFLVNQNIVMLSFWVEKSGKLIGIPEYIFEMVSRPQSIYPNKMVLILTYILPFFVSVNYPIDALHGKFSLSGTVMYILYLLVLTFITYNIWNKGLQKYASSN